MPENYEETKEYKKIYNHVQNWAIAVGLIFETVLSLLVNMHLFSTLWIIVVGTELLIAMLTPIVFCPPIFEAVDYLIITPLAKKTYQKKFIASNKPDSSDLRLTYTASENVERLDEIKSRLEALSKIDIKSARELAEAVCKYTCAVKDCHDTLMLGKIQRQYNPLVLDLLRDCQHNHKPADAETLLQATKAVKAATKTIEASNRTQYESDTIDIRSNAKVLKQLAERDMPTKGLKF